MNERIRELGLQASALALEEYRIRQKTEFAGDVIYSDIYDQKLAALIVRECVKVMYDNAIERKVPPDINQTPTHYAVAVLEHFGVEE